MLFRTPKPRRRITEWDYEEIRSQHVPEVVRAGGLNALRTLVKMLDRAISLSHPNPNKEGKYDGSNIWRPAIEEHAQNRFQDSPECQLTIAVRDAAMLLVGEGKEDLEGVVAVLQEGRWFIFERIALHLLAVAPDVSPSLIATKLLDQEVMDETTLRHEFYHLLAARFEELEPQDREAVIKLIVRPREDEVWHEGYKTQMGEPVSQVELERFRKRRVADLLSAIEDQLDGPILAEYQAITAELGKGVHPDFMFFSSSGGWVGPSSPREAPELAAMSVEELVQFLKGWQPSGELMQDDSMEGLGRTLTQVIKDNPSRYLSAAPAFKGLDPTYVRSVFDAADLVLQKKGLIDWPKLLDLCHWAAQQVDEEEKPRSSARDPGWRWARKSQAKLLNDALHYEDTPIPVASRDRVWEVIRILSDDPDPTPEHEEAYGGANMDPVNLSVNSIRSEAIRATIAYAAWVKRTGSSGQDPESRWSLDQIPEVREVLDLHLDPAGDPSLAVRSVYGQEFGLLLHLDRAWTLGAVAKIFPGSEGARQLWEAAWEAFLGVRGPHRVLFEALEKVYELAIDRIGTGDPAVRHFGRPDEELGEHLIQLYTWGALGNRPTGLIGRFFDRANPELRRHALAYIGLGLAATEDVSTDVLTRLKLFMEERISNLGEQDDLSELGAFGEWFASRKFDDDWSYETLMVILGRDGALELGQGAIRRLAEDVSARPEDVVRCLNLVILVVRDWLLDAWRDEIGAILRFALERHELRRPALEIVNRLIARGHPSYQIFRAPDK